MKAVVFHDVGDIRVEDVPKPELQNPEDAIVRITQTCICGSDLHILHGSLAVIPGSIIGHEFVGVVEEVGPAVVNVKPGDRVLGAAGIACGQCESCRSGLVIACKDLGVYGCGPLLGDLPGAQAEYIRVQYANFTLEKIPDELTDDEVVLVGDILSTAYMGALGITPGGPSIQVGDTVAIFGAGPVGLCAVAVSRLFGPARIIAIDMLDYRLDMAVRMGADYVINVSKMDVADAIAEITGGKGANFVIEAIGSTRAFDDALGVVGYGGTIACIGIYEDPVELPIQMLLPKNISIKMGLANVAHMKTLIELIRNRKLDLTPMITHKLPLEEAVKAYEMFDKKEDGVIKVILIP
ncbi:MAG: zinc-dependent alcohol dehydrogenase [Bacillota bacterium]